MCMVSQLLMSTFGYPCYPYAHLAAMVTVLAHCTLQRLPSSGYADPYSWAAQTAATPAAAAPPALHGWQVGKAYFATD
jgi:hypothetical protein